ncbi:MAG: IS200/IS605 family transposase [Saprospiraceae bacterium]|jgi:REP element-mobilizing transposase RayT|nr:IS200/IS605 family transposase [Saprospiraceae bacterium]
MAHFMSKIWVHLILSTKHRLPLISPHIEAFVHQLICKELRKMQCHVDCINGMSDHVHAQFLLHPAKSLSEVIHQVKGATSYAINQQNLLKEKFAWGGGYAAFSVSESAVPAVRKYIQNQKQHHKSRTSLEEYNEYLLRHGLNDADEKTGK